MVERCFSLEVTVTMHRFLPLFLAALVALLGVAPAHADERVPTSGWLEIRDTIRLDDIAFAEHVFMSQGATTTYQWFADGAALAGGTRQQLPIGPELLGTRLHVKSVITFDGLAPVTLTSNVSLPVITRSLHLSVTATTLECTTGQTITPQVNVERDDATLSYQWFLGQEVLPGATSHSLVLTEDMASRIPSLRVTATLAPYTDAVATDSTNCPVLPSKVTPGAVHVVGSSTVGSQIYPKMTGWLPEGRVQYTTEWLVNGESIDSEVLTLLPEWVGTQVRVRVTGRGGAMQPASVESPPMTVQPGRFTAMPRPSVTGTATVGWVLSAASAAWTPQAGLSWQWRRIDPSGADAAVAGATKPLYRVTGADEGMQLYVVATGSATGRITSSSSSAPTPPVAFNVYTTPGQRTVNGRQWRTTCAPYSRTSRCRTEIWATQVKISDRAFVKTTGWVFNNLTYLPSPRALWEGNYLGMDFEWNGSGREWRTECDTKITGKNACRSYIWTDFITSSQGAGGVWSYRQDAGWVFNNQVLFS